MSYGVNHLGHFLLTSLLMDKLKAAPACRVVNVASGAHAGVPKGQFHEDMQFDKGRKYHSFEAYAQSKLCNVYFTK